MQNVQPLTLICPKIDKLVTLITDNYQDNDKKNIFFNCKTLMMPFVVAAKCEYKDFCLKHPRMWENESQWRNCSPSHRNPNNQNDVWNYKSKDLDHCYF